jgi:hypothetical protein
VHRFRYNKDTKILPDIQIKKKSGLTTLNFHPTLLLFFRQKLLGQKDL